MQKNVLYAFTLRHSCKLFFSQCNRLRFKLVQSRWKKKKFLFYVAEYFQKLEAFVIL